MGKWRRYNRIFFTCSYLGRLDIKLHQLLSTHSLSLIHLATSLNKFSYLLVFNWRWYCDLFIHFLEKFLLISWLKRSLSIQHFIKNNSQRINICFGRIVAFFQRLRTHVQRSTNIHPIFKSILAFYWESKIWNFPFIS